MFSKIIGHKKLLKKLTELSQTPELTGSFLFNGPPSVGKRTIAFAMAKNLLCVGDKNPMCICRSCNQFNSNDHPDFLSFGQTEKIKVADVDSMLEFVSLAPFVSDRKIVVIDNADDISWEAANRLLKTLEEPPKDYLFFLITSNIGNIIDTIISRCISYDFSSLSQEDLTNIIWKSLGFELPQARVLAWLAAGSTVDIFSKAGAYLKYRDMSIDFLSVVKQGMVEALDFVDNIERKEIPAFNDMLLLVMTDLMLIHNSIEDIVNADKREDLIKISKNFNDKAVVAAAGIFTQVKKNAYLNVNLNMAMKNALIKARPLLAVGGQS